MSTPTPQTGARVIARCLQDLGVTVIFALVGIPIVDIAEQAIDIGIRVITFRNEQSCSYAASVYGYLTGRPGVCLLTGGPGVIHGLAGVGYLVQTVGLEATDGKGRSSIHLKMRFPRCSSVGRPRRRQTHAAASRN